MSLTKFNRILLDLLEGLETATGTLYEAYATKFPPEAAFWKKIAQEERGHAGTLRLIRNRVERGTITVDENVLKLEEVQKFSALLKKRIVEAQEPSFLLEDALAVASDVENALLEQPFKRVFGGEDEEVRRLLDRLMEQTRNHVETIADMRRNVGRSSVWDKTVLRDDRAPRK